MERAFNNLGKEIRVLSSSREYIGRAEDITDDGRLVVKDVNGVMHELVSGEVSIRDINGNLRGG